MDGGGGRGSRWCPYRPRCGRRPVDSVRRVREQSHPRALVGVGPRIRSVTTNPLGANRGHGGEAGPTHRNGRHPCQGCRPLAWTQCRPAVDRSASSIRPPGIRVCPGRLAEADSTPSSQSLIRRYDEPQADRFAALSVMSRTGCQPARHRVSKQNDYVKDLPRCLPPANSRKRNNRRWRDHPGHQRVRPWRARTGPETCPADPVVPARAFGRASRRAGPLRQGHHRAPDRACTPSAHPTADDAPGQRPSNSGRHGDAGDQDHRNR